MFYRLVLSSRQVSDIMFYRSIFGLRRWNAVPDNFSANSVSPGYAEDLFGGEIGNGVVDPAAAAAEDGADAAAPEGMWLTASTWLPRELLEALGRCIPGEDGTPVV